MNNEYFFSIEDVMELLFSEMFVTINRYARFEFSHAVKVAQEIGTVNAHRVNTIVGEFTGKPAVAVVDCVRDLPQVFRAIVGGATVDMVNSHTGLHGFYPREIDGMRGIDLSMLPPGIFELEILLFAPMPVVSIQSSIGCLHSAVKKQLYANDTAVPVIDIKGGVSFGMFGQSFERHAPEDDAVEFNLFRAHNIAEFEDLQTKRQQNRAPQRQDR